MTISKCARSLPAKGRGSTVGAGEMSGGCSTEVFGVLLGGILWHKTLTWSPHSPGFEENLDDDNDLLKLIN